MFEVIGDVEPNNGEALELTALVSTIDGFELVSTELGTVNFVTDVAVWAIDPALREEASDSKVEAFTRDVIGKAAEIIGDM